MRRYLRTISQLFSPVCDVERSHNQYLESIGLVGLCLYAFAFPFSKELCYIGEWMMVGAFLFSLPRIWPKLKKDPIWFALLMLLGYQIFKGIIILLDNWRDIISVLDAIRWRSRFLWVFIIAWWIGGSQQSLCKILLLSLMGFLVMLVSGYESRSIIAIERGYRINFGINAQQLGLYASTALCACLLLAKDFWGTRYRYLRIMIWVVLVFMFFYLMFLSQTRAIWFAMLAFLLFFLISSIMAINSGIIKIKTNYLMFAVLILSLLLAPIILFYSNIIHKRLSHELVTMNEMVSTGFKKIDTSTSIGKRVVLWKWSLDKIKEHPFIGWHIDRYSRENIQKGNIREKDISRFRHVHNCYLEILIDQGIIGLCLFLFNPVYVVFSVYACFKERKISYRYFMTFFSVVIVFSIANMTEAYFTSWVFWPYFSILFGGFYSLALWSRLTTENIQ